MNREKTYIQLFIDVTHVITSKLNMNEVFSLIVQKIPEVIGVDAATIRLLDTSGKKLVLRAASIVPPGSFHDPGSLSLRGLIAVYTPWGAS
jgi:hypothetical protein